MDFRLNNFEVPDGSVLMLGISYPGLPKVFTYVFLKAGGLWYGTGGGKVPQQAGWGAVERWLSRDNRVLEWVRVVTEEAPVWPSPSAPEPTAIVAQLKRQTSRVDTSQATE